MRAHPRLIIAIDGPAGTGKTTMAKLLAEKLGYLYMDTGAMYRAITLKEINSGANLKDEKKLVKLAEGTEIDFKFRPAFRVLLDGKDVTNEIRTHEVTSNVHYLAKILGVRKVMWKLQRRIGRNRGVVAEGRDIGTIVFPDADIKFYLDASTSIRVQRRHKDFLSMKRKVSLKELEKEIIMRDKKDIGRKIAPLKKATDSIFIDTTFLTIPQVLDAMLKHIPP
jgi:cytidylate kinase